MLTMQLNPSLQVMYDGQTIPSGVFKGSPNHPGRQPACEMYNVLNQLVQLLVS